MICSSREMRQNLALFASFVLLATASASVLADPPDRVARIAYLAGEASFAPAGEDTWYAAQLNRPLVAGDQLWTSRASRVELDLGGVVMRLDQGSHFEFLNLTDQFVQAQLTEGTFNLRIKYVHAEQVYEIATPTLAFVAASPGEFRLDVDAEGRSTQVTVFDGHATVYGEDGQSLALRAGATYRFHTPGQLAHQHGPLPSHDDFNRWAFARNGTYVNSPSLQYVSSEMIGYADLDRHGSWRHVSDYGHVWFPRRVVAGWAPYRHGNWAWIDPWGWTWVDDAPWGFAPFHYGRWVYVANGWGWVPGPRHLRPVYAPALVAFVGGAGWSLTVSSAGPPVGWFPLGPRDVYMPWYRCSRSYFGRVNVHNTYVFNNVFVTNIYNDYYVQGRPLRRDYTFRSAANAVTVVPRDAFAGGRRAVDHMARLRPGVIDRGEILARAPANPTRASLTGGQERSRAIPPSRALNRSVIARSEPPMRPASFETRERAIARNGGEPLAMDQMRRLSAARGDDARAVRVIGRDASPANTASVQPAGIGTRPTAARSSGRDARGTPAAATAARPTIRDSARSERSLPSTRYSARGEASHRGATASGSDARSVQRQPGSAARAGTTQRGTTPSRSEGIPLPRQSTAVGAGRAPVGARGESTIAPSRAPVDSAAPAPSRSAPAPSAAQRGTPRGQESIERAVPRAPVERTGTRGIPDTSRSPISQSPRAAASGRFEPSTPAPAARSTPPSMPTQRGAGAGAETRSPIQQRQTPAAIRPAAPARTQAAPVQPQVPSRSAAPVQQSQPAPTRSQAAPPATRESARPAAPERGDRAESRRGNRRD